MSWLPLVLVLVTIERLVELAIARRNTRRLLARGAVELGATHYSLLVLLHASWLMALGTLVPFDRAPVWPLLSLYILLQPLRFWVLGSLGQRWTTRILVLPGRPLVATGPYRWLRHPNYLLVALEMPLLPTAFRAYGLALGFGLANLALLAWRIHVEEAALVGAAGLERRERAVDETAASG